MTMGARRRAIVLIVEGLAPDLCRQWSDCGLLPGFSELFENGARGSISSGFVPYEPPGLVSAFTGTKPGEHGWFSYWNVHESDYRPRPITSEDVRVPFLWQRPEMADKRFALINLFGTHPPRHLNGWVITYPTLQTLRACYPSRLLLELAQRNLPYTHDVSVWFGGQKKDDFVPLVLEADCRRGAIAAHLLDQGADVVIVNLTSVDRMSHCYWQEIEPDSPVPLLDGAIFQAYQCCDRIISDFLHRRASDTSLLVFSEIGFGPLRTYVDINQILAHHKLFEWEDHEQAAVRWNRTFAFEAVQGTQGININLNPRYSQGIVTQADYESCRSQVIEVLAQTINPHTGLALFKQIARREEIYPGQGCWAAPDLILEPADPRYLPLGEPLWASHVKRRLQSGWHRRTSCWAAVGENFEAGSQATATLIDIVPTIYHMLGMAPPADLAGAFLEQKSRDALSEIHRTVFDIDN
jgi:predicted AlkP superfamily phosphohydrolase/phosphomutase